MCRAQVGGPCAGPKSWADPSHGPLCRTQVTGPCAGPKSWALVQDPSHGPLCRTEVKSWALAQDLICQFGSCAGLNLSLGALAQEILEPMSRRPCPGPCAIGSSSSCRAQFGPLRRTEREQDGLKFQVLGPGEVPQDVGPLCKTTAMEPLSCAGTTPKPWALTSRHNVREGFLGRLRY